MLVSITLYIIFNFCGCVKKTGNTETDSYIEYFNNNYPDDNIFEEALENKIEDWSGFDLDLSPRSRELD
jgi:hypothetical protein